MKKLALIATAVMTMMAVGCQETLQESLEMTSSEKSVAVEGETSPLSFTASSAWTIASDADWVTFDRTEGEAGDVTVEMTVAANDGYESRTAKVTITMGAKSNVITITQAGRAEFAIETVYNISAEAQTIDFAIESNIEYTYEISEDAQSWIKIVPESKAAPASSTLSFSVDENILTPREGKIFVEAGENIYSLVVKQRGAGDEMTTATATYLGNTMFIYDYSSYAYTSFHEYVIALTSKDGNSEVYLAINVAEQDDYLTAIPVGEYVVDATGAHTENTFSIKPLDRTERYYTTIKKNGVETEVVDGVISISNTDGTYLITATLYDATGTSYSYIYSGEIDTIVDESFGAMFYSMSFNNTYDTYYSTKSNQWYIALSVSSAPSADVPYLQYITFTINGPTGEISDPENIPEGTYTYAEVTYIDSEYPNGITDAKPNTFYLEYANDVDQNECTWGEGSEIIITKNEDGTYNIEFTNTKVTSSVSGTFDYNVTFKNLAIGTVDRGSEPKPDGDTEFTSFFNASGLWYANRFNESGNAFVLSLNLIDYVVELSLNANATYEFNNSPRPGYSTNPIPYATYTYSETASADNLILPAMYVMSDGSIGLYATITNNYTGSKFVITGGTLTIDAGTFIFDLTASNGTDTYQYTGTVSGSVQYLRDYSTRVLGLPGEATGSDTVETFPTLDEYLGW